MDESEKKAAPQADKNMTRRATSLLSDPQGELPADQTWLTAGEVMERTGITKRDLVAFIKKGGVPAAMMRISAEAGENGKKSHFSTSVLDRLSALKRLKDEGYSMDETVREFRETGDDKPLPANRLEENRPGGESALQPAASPAFHLAAETASASIIFVDRDLRIGWIQVGRTDRLSSAIRDERANDPSGTVFDIMLRASLKELFFNWQPLFTFTYRFLKETTPPDTFRQLAPTISMNPDQSDAASSSPTGRIAPSPIDSCPIRIEDDEGRMREMRIYALSLAEGTLFFLGAENERPDHLADRSKKPAATPATDADAAGKTPFSVLSARLDESRSIVDTLLPETYFQLMTRIWDECDRVLATYGGHRARRSGTEVQYIIPRHADLDPAYDAICCAVKLREKMREIEASLKADEGWFADLRLNIGISSGRDHLKEEDPTASMAFMLPGGAADQAFHLSAIARGGAIWITKSAFGHLSSQQVQRIIFGIYRGERLIRNIFAPLAELWQAPDAPPLGRGIRSLSVTRIIGLHPEAARSAARNRR